MALYFSPDLENQGLAVVLIAYIHDDQQGGSVQFGLVQWSQGDLSSVIIPIL